MLRNKGIETYSLHLKYTKGIHGHKIGANAGNIELPDEFAVVLFSEVYLAKK